MVFDIRLLTVNRMLPLVEWSSASHISLTAIERAGKRQDLLEKVAQSEVTTEQKVTVALLSSSIKG